MVNKSSVISVGDMDNDLRDGQNAGNSTDMTTSPPPSDSQVDSQSKKRKNEKETEVSSMAVFWAVCC